MVTGLLAQEAAADETSRTVTLIIIGLLIVALLLAALTVWYWRFTDPKRRMRTPVADPIYGSSAGDSFPGETDQSGGYTAVAPQVEARSQETSAPLAADGGSDADLLDDDGADEWLRLTGPQASRRSR